MRVGTGKTSSAFQSWEALQKVGDNEKGWGEVSSSIVQIQLHPADIAH